ncbi:MAG: GAF domain-containing protein [Sphingomonadaceae bacterium]|nr:GAF domain-containing protein [Sphingomonadaceae bacterium]
MFAQPDLTALPKPELYAELARQIAGVTDGEPNAVANMANAAALIFHALPDLSWAGFYLVDPADGGLVLGPFQGKVACVRIPIGRGVCGTAAAERRTIVVPDVEAFPGHIACDDASRSELVAPLLARDGRLLGVLDLDSPTPGRFDDEDAAGMERIAGVLTAVL